MVFKFETHELAEQAYSELEAKYKALDDEKTALLRKRDELLGEVRSLKDKYGKFSGHEELDIAHLLDIKQKYEAGDDATKKKYEEAYNRDKASLEARLKAIEEEREREKQEREQERQRSEANALKADAIAELSKASYNIRNPEQFWRLFGEGQIQRGENGLYIGDEYKKTPIGEWINKIAEDENNAHHFKPKGGSGGGANPGGGGGGKAQDNPWRKETWNLTKQGQIFRSNPELAARLKAEAGAK